MAMTRPAYVQLAVRVPPELKERLERVADQEQRPVSDVVRELVREGLAKRHFGSKNQRP